MLMSCKLKEIEGITYLCSSTGHFSCDILQEQGGTKTLLMTQSNAVLGISATLENWTMVSFPKVWQSLPDIMSQVSIYRGCNKSPDDEGGVKIVLSDQCITQVRSREAWVYMTIEVFVRGVVAHFAEYPHLDISQFGCEFRNELERKWQDVLQELRPKSRVAA